MDISLFGLADQLASSLGMENDPFGYLVVYPMAFSSLVLIGWTGLQDLLHPIDR